MRDYTETMKAMCDMFCEEHGIDNDGCTVAYSYVEEVTSTHGKVHYTHKIDDDLLRNCSNIKVFIKFKDYVILITRIENGLMKIIPYMGTEDLKMIDLNNPFDVVERGSAVVDKWNKTIEKKKNMDKLMDKI